MRKTLVVLTGPTGIGKTAIGVKIATRFKTEIVSADSRQIYKELQLGTAIPDENELLAVKHHFIQSHSIHENYNASRYEFEALALLKSLFRKHDILMLVGGSMLYIHAVCNGIDAMPDVDPEIRTSLQIRLQKEGLEGLRLQLKKMDPEYYKTVDLKNPARIIHALEICLMTGRPYSDFRQEIPKIRPFNILKIILNCERKKLHDKINKRVDQMVAMGLEKEARSVYQYRHLNALNTVGYREWFAHFDGEITKEKAIELMKRNTRRYARKQLTWFKKDPEMKWFEPDQTKKIIAYIEQYLNKL